MILEFTVRVYILDILMDLQQPFKQHVNLFASHLEALDAGQVVQLLCRLHRDAAGQGRVLPLHG